MLPFGEAKDRLVYPGALNFGDEGFPPEGFFAAVGFAERLAFVLERGPPT